MSDETKASATVSDYLRWRGDLTFAQDGFNEVDNLLLCIISYIKLENIPRLRSFDPKDAMPMGDVCRLLTEEDEQLGLSTLDYIPLMRQAAETPRFREVSLFAFESLHDEDRQMQFAAVSFLLPDGSVYAAYRGTDMTIVGWQEDFNMFFTFPLPSQKKALDYFEKAVRMLNGKFILGGHSKGGNLAVYAGAFTDENSRNHIDYIYNFDGPGFSLDKIRDSGFYEVDDRIYTFVPQSSIFGMIFEHEESYTIVKSNQKGFLQHDVYSWEIEQNRLIRLKSTTNFSVFFDHTLKEFVESLTVAQRREFTKEVFALLSLTETATFNEMLKNPLKNTGTILKSFAGLDSKTRNMLLKTIFAFVKSAKNNFSDITGGQNKITVS